jgi:protein-disulfide isomerase
METNETNKYFLPVAVVVAGLIIAGAVIWNGSRPVPSAGSGQADASSVDIKNVKTDGDPFIGKADAPITIAFWSDFQCPFCKKFELETFPSIVKDYVDSGNVKIVFKDVVFLSPRMGMDSLTAVLYGQSVWKLYPESYLEWRMAMFVAQDEEGGGFGDAASIEKLNATIRGIDAAKVAEDVKTNMDAYTQVANATTAEAQKLGVNATPSLIIGTQIIAGAYPYPTFKTAIDALLK